MKKSLKKNYIYNLSYQLLSIILPLITAPYLARTLGASGTGTFGYTVSIVTYFVLFGTLGITLYGQREIAFVQNNIKKRSKTFFELFFLRVIMLSLSAFIFYILFARCGEYSLYYKILLLDLLANAFDINFFFQGLEEFQKLVVRNFIVRITSLIFILTFVKSTNDVWIYLLIYALTNLISAFILWINIHKYVDFNELKNMKLTRHLKPIIILFIPQIAIQVYTVLDKTMIGLILSDMSEVGYYEQAQKLIKMVMTIITSTATVMIPRIANFYATGEHEKINKYMIRTFNFIYMLAFPIIFGLIAVSNNFVPVFFGEGFDKVVPILCVMSFIVLFIGFSGIIGNQYLLPTMKQKEFTISVVCGSIINFICNLILIPKFMSIGATIATVIAEFSVMAIQFWFIRKNFDIKKIVRLSFNYVFASVIMLFSCLSVGNFIDNNLISLILQIVVGAIIYFTLLLLLNDQLLIYLLNSLGNKLSFIKKIKKNTIDKLSDKGKLLLTILIILISLVALIISFI